jgi:Ohr subfamily peroxiredoxin
MKNLYTARVHVSGGRDGRAASDDSNLDVKMAFPKALGGAGDGVNPEQLFAAGFAGCFISSLKHAAQAQGVSAGQPTVDADATLTVSDDGRYGLSVTLSVHMPALEGDVRARVIEEAKRICAYSNATRGNVEVTIL